MNNENYRLILQRLQGLECNYLKWTNYWSLFNGALLVAYCTILMNEKAVCSNFHWKLLSIITLLGVIASYGWYLSAKGHYYWINSWQKNLKSYNCDTFDNEIYARASTFHHTLCHDCILPHFYSTYKVVNLFILSVLAAWILVLGYTFGKNILSLTEDTVVIGSLFIFLFLIVLENYLHFILGSKLTNMTLYDIGVDEKKCIIRKWMMKPYIQDSIFMIIASLVICWLLYVNMTIK